MKIVRLTENNGQTAFFDNTFNDEIELPPFSEVALSSVSINTDEKSINIQAGTLVAWDRGAAKSSMDSGGAALPGQFTPGTYTDTTHTNLFFDVQANLNRWQQDDAGQAGRQWGVNDDPTVTGFGIEGKVAIGYQTANYEGAKVEAYAHTNITETGTGLSAVYSKNTASPGPEGYLLSKEPLGWGKSRFYVNVNTITQQGGIPASAEGFFMGLSTTNYFKESTTPTMGDATVVIGMHVKHEGELVDLYNGASVITDDSSGGNILIAAGQLYGFEMQMGDASLGTRPENNILAVRYFANGTAGFPEYQGSQVGTTYAQLEYGELGPNGNKPLYPFVIFFGNTTNTKIDQVQLSPDPYPLITSKRYPIITTTTGGRGMQNSGDKPILNFNWGNSVLIGNFLGFSNKLQRTMKDDTTALLAASFSWVADAKFSDGIKGEGFYVELMTGTCEGYDGETGQRKNILAVIPESDSDKKILFQPATPLFLEMNNSNPLVLRNIRARLLRTDGSPVEVDGMNSMTLLYKPGKSK